MAIRSKKTQDKLNRNEKIKKLYGQLMSDPESMKYGAYEQLGFKFGLSMSTIGRIVGNIKTSKS